MLTDTKLKNLKGGERLYKVADRDGLYVAVSPQGLVTFRLDYRLNGRRETLTIGRYGPTGISLAEAREQCLQAKRAISEGRSPSREKQRSKKQIQGEKTFGVMALDWIENATMAKTTRGTRRHILDKDLLPEFQNRLLSEISGDDVRHVCDKMKARGAPSSAVHAHGIIAQIYGYAADRGHKVPNPAAEVRASAIATLKGRTRVLTPKEIQSFFVALPATGTTPSLRIALELLLLTMVRKSELTEATWSELDLEQAEWSIPAERMKGRRPHNVYLSKQAVKLFQTLKVCAGSSDYVLPSFFGRNKPISKSSLNSSIDGVVLRASEIGQQLGAFGPHDLRRTGSTILHEAGFNSDWIEKCLAHEQKGVRAIYNKAEYAEQRRHMMEEWANMLDAMKAGRPYKPALVPPEVTPA
ncbi:site-specific integrase [Cupriavidus sp. UYPR2.512]|uniref:tyrosine-type recombinase/integrase n=1 Tax=Cupriavidus sp. UYPR2.512 TaxID=1080187 RepID=UPI000374EE98|nr:site-specific integrase [Cupriavidus sp. UYPR2.512]